MSFRKGLAEAEVIACPGARQALDAIGPVQVQTDRAGQYSISVPPGRSTVIADLEGYTERTLDLLETHSAPGLLTEDVVLYPNDASVSGTVTDGESNGAAPEGTTVSFELQIAHDSDEDFIQVC